MIKENLARVKEKIREAALRAGRKPQDITLICVIKNTLPVQVEEVIACGITDIGENKVQDALSKHGQLTKLSTDIKWHMVGHLQTNKVKTALGIFDVIHSLDSLKLAEEISKRAGELGKRIECFIEVNTSGEASKYGISPDELPDFVNASASFQNINIIGLMTMAPFAEKAELVRPYFSRLRKLKEEINALRIPRIEMNELSMGMSQDFEVAIEEGATFVRVGSAIFKDKG